MLLSICFYQFIIFEFSIDGSCLLFFPHLLIVIISILNYYFPVLPSSPYLVFYLFLLFRCLFQSVYDVLLSSLYLYQLMLFTLLYYHLSPSLFSLVPCKFNLLWIFLLSWFIFHFSCSTQLWSFEGCRPEIWFIFRFHRWCFLKEGCWFLFFRFRLGRTWRIWGVTLLFQSLLFEFFQILI